MNIHPTAIIDPGADIGDAEIGPFCRVASGAVIHDGVTLQSHVVVEGGTEVGAGTVVHPFAVLGGPPQHLGYKGEPTRLVIGENCIIREHTTMNRGTVAGGGLTRVGKNGMYMAGAHVAHDCTVGDNVIFANCATIGGHVIVGDFTFLGGLCAVHQHCRVGDYAFIGGCAAVVTDIIPFCSAVGNRARLGGLNIIGLKRRGFSRETIHEMRAAYRHLFFGEGVFKERLEAVRGAYAANAEVMRIVAFIDDAGGRALMTPVHPD
ncbi:MAG: acyl-ACP--UDP-N-acetylglucosamine O-acyltransferase [Parvularculaceae bacterium]